MVELHRHAPSKSPVDWSRWHFDIDTFINPFIPAPPWRWVPRPIAHFLGYREDQPSRPIGNLVIAFWALIGVFCSVSVVTSVTMNVPSFQHHNAPVVVASMVCGHRISLGTLPDVSRVKQATDQRAGSGGRTSLHNNRFTLCAASQCYLQSDLRLCNRNRHIQVIRIEPSRRRIARVERASGLRYHHQSHASHQHFVSASWCHGIIGSHPSAESGLVFDARGDLGDGAHAGRGTAHQ